MLKISMIAPFEVMDIAQKYSDFIMTLYPLFQKHKDKYEAALLKSDKPIYLDNGFFETKKAASVAEMQDMIDSLNPKIKERITHIIAPDGEIDEKSNFVVPKNTRQLREAFNFALSNSNLKIGISCIHVMNLKGGNFTHYSRYDFIESCLGQFFNAKEAQKIRMCGCLHFLGTNNQPYEEFKVLTRAYNGSLDSSAFVWPYLAKGEFFTAIDSKFSTPCDFEFSVSKELRASLDENLAALRNGLVDYGFVPKL